MGTKKKNTAPVSNINASDSTAEKGASKKKLSGTQLFVMIFAIVAVVAIIVSIVIAVAGNANNKIVDYKNDDLSRYVSISYDDYSSFNVVANIDPVTDRAVENEIIKLLYNNREKGENLKNVKGEPVHVGDDVNMYYMGYTLDPDGNKLPFTGGCNFGSSLAYTLGIGSGSFVEGFELGLIGKDQDDYATFSKTTSGTVTGTETLFITYTAINDDGSYEKDAIAIIDLTDEATLEKWGEEFKLYLTGATYGTKLSETYYRNYIDENGNTCTDAISDVTVNAAVEFGEGEPLTVEAYFPVGYSTPSLAGKTVLFDVYIMTTKLYDTPEFTDEFITDTLCYTAEELAEYEGERLTDKYRSMIREKLERDYEDALSSAIESAMWQHYMDKATIKRLPDNEVFDYYNSYVSEVDSYYAYYSSYYTDYDAAACDYLQLDSGTDWRAYLRKNAETSISQKLVFYYVIQKENIYPSEELQAEKREQLIEAYLEDYLDYYKIYRSNYDTREEYDAAVESYRTTVIGSYGENYFTENAIFLAAMDRISSFANVIYANAND